jgi:hypothetical protein
LPRSATVATATRLVASAAVSGTAEIAAAFVGLVVRRPRWSPVLALRSPLHLSAWRLRPRGCRAGLDEALRLRDDCAG